MSKMIIRFFFLLTLIITGSSLNSVNAEAIKGLTSNEARIQEKISKRISRRKKPSAKALDSVCTNISNLSGLLVKITAGGHIGRSDPRYPGWSIICAGKCASFPARVYHCDGSTAWNMGYYGRWSGNGKARGYCGSGGAGACSVSSTRSANKSKKCQGAVYLDTDGTKGKKCMRFNVNSSRNGGV